MTAPDEEPCGKEETTRFRALAATGNYLAQDRLDQQYAAKEVCRDMASPKPRSWKKMKRMARYLLEFPRLIWEYGPAENDEDGDVLDVYGDSDWAGCLRTRRSTSGGVASIARGAVKSWSGTQSTIALSSGEAEYYSTVRAAAEALGIQALMRDMGIEIRIRLWVDAEAAKGIASRCGLGKVRHLETKLLWLQEAISKKKLELKKIWGAANPGDLATKPKSSKDIEEFLKIAGGRLCRRVREAKSSICVASCEACLRRVTAVASGRQAGGNRVVYALEHRKRVNFDPRPHEVCRFIVLSGLNRKVVRGFRSAKRWARARELQTVPLDDSGISRETIDRIQGPAAVDEVDGLGRGTLRGTMNRDALCKAEKDPLRGTFRGAMRGEGRRGGRFRLTTTPASGCRGGRFRLTTTPAPQDYDVQYPGYLPNSCQTMEKMIYVFLIVRKSVLLVLLVMISNICTFK